MKTDGKANAQTIYIHLIKIEKGRVEGKVVLRRKTRQRKKMRCQKGVYIEQRERLNLECISRKSEDIPREKAAKTTTTTIRVRR